MRPDGRQDQKRAEALSKETTPAVLLYVQLVGQGRHKSSKTTADIRIILIIVS